VSVPREQLTRDVTTSSERTISTAWPRPIVATGQGLPSESIVALELLKRPTIKPSSGRSRPRRR
jgi:hypothetical protein